MTVFTVFAVAVAVAVAITVAAARQTGRKVLHVVEHTAQKFSLAGPQRVDRVVDLRCGSHILTDDKAPVEVLGMRVLDELIAGELDYYRENFSLQEILGMLG